MKHLLHVINYSTKPKFEKLGILNPNKKQRFICYEINDYWFRLVIKQWSAQLNIPYNQIRNRIAKELPWHEVFKW